MPGFAKELSGRKAAALSLVLLWVIIAALSQLPPTNDAAWQLWIGRRLSGGAELYRDIIEINPPLWFWIAIPIVQIADALEVSGWTALLVFFGLAAACSIALAQKSQSERDRWLPFVLLFCFFIIGVSATGQREQFTLITFVPYLYLTASRANGQRPPTWLAIAIGLWAGVGVVLKPYFVLAPAALEVWLLANRRWSLRPEILALAILGAIYVSAVVLITPQYLSLVPFIREAYASFDRPVHELLVNEIVVIVGVALLGAAFIKPRSATASALMVASLAFLAAFIVQEKAFRYHGLPAIGLACVLALQLLREAWGNVSRSVAAILILPPALGLATTLNHASWPVSPEYEILCDRPAGSRVLVLTVYGDAAWPAVEMCGLEWTSRYMFLWMLPTIAGDPDRSRALATRTKSAVVEDIVRHEPELIMIQRGGNRLNADAWAFLQGDPAFRAVLSSYDRTRSFEDLIVYQRGRTNPQMTVNRNDPSP